MNFTLLTSSDVVFLVFGACVIVGGLSASAGYAYGRLEQIAEHGCGHCGEDEKEGTPE